MYSDVKNVRILVALLKEYGVRTAVLSSGTCSIPVIHSVEIDSFFDCYSDIDERSAVYCAIGLSQMKREPVAVVCTSGTAACNYLPGVCEAMKQQLPVVVITCDKDQGTLGHLTIQKIDQEYMFGKNCKLSVCVPAIKDENDDWAARLLISQALMEMTHNGCGPVHINIYTDGDKKTFNTRELPKVKKIERINYARLIEKKEELETILKKKSKILVVMGENSISSSKLSNSIEKFCNKFGAVWSAEHVANTHSSQSFNTYKVFEQTSAHEFNKHLKPDLIISMGENYASYGIKSLLRQSACEHWWIDPKGRVVDAWRSITKVFECEFIDFFMLFNDDVTGFESEYQRHWKAKMESIHVPSEGYTSLFAVKTICEQLSNCSIFHMGILNSTRLVHLFDLPLNVHAYSNLGALGIDGSLSSFLGQASVNTHGHALCIIGDLSFFYDINSLYNIDIPTNVKIVLLNNGGGSEFHLNTGIDVIPMIDKYIAAGHTNVATEWAKASGMQYLKAQNSAELLDALNIFFSNKGPTLLEVITDIENDSLAIKEMFKANGYIDGIGNKRETIKRLLISLVGIEKTQKIVRMAKIWREK